MHLQTAAPVPRRLCFSVQTAHSALGCQSKKVSSAKLIKFLYALNKLNSKLLLASQRFALSKSLEWTKISALRQIVHKSFFVKQLPSAFALFRIYFVFLVSTEGVYYESACII